MGVEVGVADLAKKPEGNYEPILLKNNVLQLQKVATE